MEGDDDDSMRRARLRLITEPALNRANWLKALISRLEACTPGATYELDPVERELLLEALKRAHW